MYEVLLFASDDDIARICHRANNNTGLLFMPTVSTVIVDVGNCSRDTPSRASKMSTLWLYSNVTSATKGNPVGGRDVCESRKENHQQFCMQEILTANQNLPVDVGKWFQFFPSTKPKYCDVFTSVVCVRYCWLPHSNRYREYILCGIWMARLDSEYLSRCHVFVVGHFAIAYLFVTIDIA